jgi:hypothetical protein
MNRKGLFIKAGKTGFVSGAVLLITLTGCVGSVEGPRAGVQAEPYAFAMQDDYVYYPNYECYYSVSRHQYAYREGNAWVARPAPPGVPVDVLLASPSVKMDFHDSPSQHHATVVRQYPKNWKPPGPNQSRNENQKNGKHAENDGI